MLKLLTLVLPLVFGTNAEAAGQPPMDFNMMGQGFNDNSMEDKMKPEEQQHNNEAESMASKDQEQGENNA